MTTGILGVSRSRDKSGKGRIGGISNTGLQNSLMIVSNKPLGFSLPWDCALHYLLS